MRNFIIKRDYKVLFFVMLFIVSQCVLGQLRKPLTEWNTYYQLDLFSGIKLWSVIPDLDEVNKGTHEYYNFLFDFVNLKDALDERFKKAPPVAFARIYSYWLYAEGVWAEELLRKNKQAEESAVLAEELNSMGKNAELNIDRSAEINESWKTILKSQHHDISWAVVTDLRRKSINQLDSAIHKTKEIMSDISGKLVKSDGKSVAVFNGVSHSRKCIAFLDGEKSFYQIDNKDIKPTAFYFMEGELWTRGYKIPSGDKSELRDFEIFNQPLKDLVKIVSQGSNSKMD